MTYNTKEYTNVYNYDNNFSVRIKLENGNTLNHLTANIFILNLPKISMSSFADEDSVEPLKLSLRSTKDGSVENEVYNVLCKSKFNIEISLTNPNKVDFTFYECDVSAIEFAQLAHKNKANPFNFDIEINYLYAKYFNSGETFIIGNAPVDLLSEINPKNKKEGKNNE